VNEYRFVVIVKCETWEQAQQVIQERIYFDEDYGFDYEVDIVTPVDPCAGRREPEEEA
jgi:hypothetical protein